MGGLDDVAFSVLTGRRAGNAVAVQHQRVAGSQQDWLLDFRQFADTVNQFLALVAPQQAELGAGGNIRALVGFGHEAFSIFVDDA